VINVDETRWPRLGFATPASGTAWGVYAPTVAFYRILPGKSTDEGRQALGGYRGTAVVDGFAAYEVLAREVNQSLTVREAVYEGMFDTPKTEAGVRRIPLSEGALRLIRQWRERVTGTAPEALLFSTWSGKPISPNNVLKTVASGAQRAGLPRVSWLTFRRTYSSWAHDRGVPGKIAATLMGHAKVDTTLNVYTQVLDASLRGAVAKVGSELFTIVHNPEAATELSR
jgi:hypothetical protein